MKVAAHEELAVGGPDMVKVRDGLIIEHWALLDLAAMREQLGWDT